MLRGETTDAPHAKLDEAAATPELYMPSEEETPTLTSDL